MHLFLMIVGWWAVGIVTCHLLRRVIAPRIDGGCPKCPKCWIGSLVSTLYGLGQYFYMQLAKLGYSSPEYLYTLVFAGLVGGAVYLIICPIPTRST